jgi:hypothetical protein
MPIQCCDDERRRRIGKLVDGFRLRGHTVLISSLIPRYLSDGVRKRAHDDRHHAKPSVS